MARRCALTGKSVMTGNKVSHSNIKTRRRYLPNLQTTSMLSDALGRSVRLRVSAHAIRTVDKCGGLDAFLLKSRNAELTPDMRALKKQIERAREDAGATAPAAD